MSSTKTFGLMDINPVTSVERIELHGTTIKRKYDETVCRQATIKKGQIDTSKFKIHDYREFTKISLSLQAFHNLCVSLSR